MKRIFLFFTVCVIGLFIVLFSALSIASLANRGHFDDKRDIEFADTILKSLKKKNSVKISNLYKEPWEFVCPLDEYVGARSPIQHHLGGIKNNLTFYPKEGVIMSGHWGLAFYHNDAVTYFEIPQQKIVFLSTNECLDKSEAYLALSNFKGKRVLKLTSPLREGKDL